MEKVHLEALGLEVPLGPFQSYTDHGYVEDPRLFAVKFHGGDTQDFLKRREAGEKYTNLVAGFAWSKALGRNATHLLHSQKYPLTHSIAQVHICYRRGKEDFRNLKVRAHEESHAVQALGLGPVNVLERALRDEQGVSIDLASIEDAETFAELGAIYALYKTNSSLLNFWLGMKGAFQKAFTLYMDNGGKSPKIGGLYGRENVFQAYGKAYPDAIRALV
jgi:hypothetical protein